MRLHLGELPPAGEMPPDAQDWQAIRSPSTRLAFGLAAAAGMALVAVLCLGLLRFVSMAGGRE